MHANPDRFVGEDVVVTEKLDGGNTLLHAGKVYARSVSAPSEAMARDCIEGFLACLAESGESIPVEPESADAVAVRMEVAGPVAA